MATRGSPHPGRARVVVLAGLLTMLGALAGAVPAWASTHRVLMRPHRMFILPHQVLFPLVPHWSGTVLDNIRVTNTSSEPVSASYATAVGDLTGTDVTTVTLSVSITASVSSNRARVTLHYVESTVDVNSVHGKALCRTTQGTSVRPIRSTFTETLVEDLHGSFDTRLNVTGSGAGYTISFATPHLIGTESDSTKTVISFNCPPSPKPESENPSPTPVSSDYGEVDITSHLAFKGRHLTGRNSIRTPPPGIHGKYWETQSWQLTVVAGPIPKS
ncbi:MAG TPA: hypothetical protein VK425_03540 [Acidimicrobiales bacterium]|nr:hypothetical protein [Acidimicrobiales bacterium]